MQNKKHGNARRGQILSKKLILLLVAMGTLIPTGALSGVNLIYPNSTPTIGDVISAPLAFAAGADSGSTSYYVTTAWAGGGGLSNATSFTVTVLGTPGLQVVIDDISQLYNQTALTNYKVKITTAISGTLVSNSRIDTTNGIKLRVWTGSTAPTADGDSQVKRVITLHDGSSATAVNTESAAITGMGGSPGMTSSTPFKIQIVIDLKTTAVSGETATFTIAPSSLTLP